MNNLFIDLVEKNAKNNFIDEFLLKTVGFVLKEDKILKTKTTTTLFLKFNMDKFVKSSRNVYLLKTVLKNNIKNKRNINVIFSKRFNNLEKIRNELKSIITSINEESKYIASINNLREKDMHYIERYIVENNVDKNKFKILMIVDNIKDLEIENIKKYIEEYKFLDILRMQNISKNDYKKMSKFIDEVNNEYGTSIEIIQKRNIQNYDFYILYSKNRKEYFNSHYILNKKSYTLDITDVDDDILSREYKLYEKNKGYITTLFDRMSINKENFYKTDLGSLYN